AGAAGTTFIGWNRPEVIEAVKKQLEFPHAFFGHINLPRVELAEKLARITPPNLIRSWFATGGGEANEAAVKASIKYTGKKEVISLYNGFHGISIGMLSLGHRRLREGFPVVPGFRQIPSPYCYRCFYGKSYPGCDFECARALESAIEYGSSYNVAAFLIEPVQGMGGHIFGPSIEYGKIIREICDKYGIVVIADEIQSGFGRTGKMWACEVVGLKPDTITLGKALGGGYPISAAVFSDAIADAFKDKDPTQWWQPLTFSGNPLSCAAASAVVDVVTRDNAAERAAMVGKSWMKRLKEMEMDHSIVGDVRGPGLFFGMEIVRDKKTKEKGIEEASKIVNRCFEKGAIYGLSQPYGLGNVIKIKPPYVISEEESTKALDILDEAITEVEKSMK
ncbi:MAG: aminotransferase class III-fold pyridoxal phosphate-dependent enzyme, partial [Candidatus Bathyarchaeia archaeon]